MNLQARIEKWMTGRVANCGAVSSRARFWLSSTACRHPRYCWATSTGAFRLLARLQRDVGPFKGRRSIPRHNVARTVMRITGSQYFALLNARPSR